MLSAAASAIPRLRCAAPPRQASSRTQWSLLWRRPLSSSPNVAPAAAAASGPGALEPPDLPRLAKSARISLSPQEAEEFAPKIQQVVDCSLELALYDIENKPEREGLRKKDNSLMNYLHTAVGSSLREDKAEPFANRDAIIEALPSYDDPYIKVPRVLNSE
ncbi:hypothetical protein QYE76_063295 [Lolium multiflorum]|uniref:Glu-AdT subunit C n=1 Tax=Lolium multiflorum TaxID=4521 RepID=A0AAD8S5E6_LOLMU|nr:hypothetical protein QYE76_063295 [Lolium multiflorum]